MDAQRICYHEAGHVAAAITYGLPIIKVSIEDFDPHLLRGRFRRERTSGTEAIVITCLSGPAAEELFFGPITDHSDLIDRRMARGYLRDVFTNAEIGYQMLRMQYAAERLVAASQPRISIIATALLRLGSLSGDEVAELIDEHVSLRRRI